MSFSDAAVVLDVVPNQLLQLVLLCPGVTAPGKEQKRERQACRVASV